MKTMKKIITNGNYVECDIIPYTENQAQYWRDGKRKKRVNHSSIKQQKANEKHSKRHFLQLVNGNFENNDYFVTCSYSAEAPEYDTAKKDLQRFVGRLKDLYKKHNTEFKYIAVIEQGKRHKRLHIHIIIPKGVPSEEIKKRWKKGNCDVRLLFGGSDEGGGFKKLTQYLTKNRPMNSRRWQGSKNLKQPTIQRIFENVSKAVYNTIISAVICKEHGELAAIVKNHIGKEYTFTDCETAENPVLYGINVYFKLWKKAPETVRLCC